MLFMFLSIYYLMNYRYMLFMFLSIYYLMFLSVFCVNVCVLATSCEINCPLGILKIFQFNSICIRVFVDGNWVYVISECGI